MQEALAALGRELATDRALDDMLALIVERAAEALGCPRASVRLFDASSTRLLAAARYGAPMNVGHDAEFRLGEGLVGWIASEGRILRTPRADLDPRFAPRAGVTGPLGSFLGVPLVSRGECIGVLSAVHPDEGYFVEEHETILTLIAALCAPRVEVARLERLATIDPLTGVLNRRGLDVHLASHSTSAERAPGVALAALMIDIDHFKRVNDEHGHAVGDEVLRHVSAILARTLRVGDAVARWGGEEFLVFLADVEPERALAIAERARSGVETTPAGTSRGPLGVTVSVGLAMETGDEARAALIERADAALYEAKRAGRNRVVAAAA